MLAIFMAISPTLVLTLLIASFLQHVSSLLVNLSVACFLWRDLNQGGGGAVFFPVWHGYSLCLVI